MRTTTTPSTGRAEAVRLSPRRTASRARPGRRVAAVDELAASSPPRSSSPASRYAAQVAVQLPPSIVDGRSAPSARGCAPERSTPASVDRSLDVAARTPASTAPTKTTAIRLPASRSAIRAGYAFFDERRGTPFCSRVPVARRSLAASSWALRRLTSLLQRSASRRRRPSRSSRRRPGSRSGARRRRPRARRRGSGGRTWGLRVCSSLAKGVQSGERLPRQRAQPLGHEPPREASSDEGRAGVSVRARARAGCPREACSRSRQTRRRPGSTLGDHDHSLAAGPPQQAGRRAADDLPARALGEAAPVGPDRRVAGPPVGEVVRLGEQLPDVAPGAISSVCASIRTACDCHASGTSGHPRVRIPRYDRSRGGGRGTDLPRRLARPRSSRSRVPRRSISSRRSGDDEHRDGDRAEPRRRERHQRPHADLAAHEPRDAPRVDRAAPPRLQPRQERRRHPGPVPLEELDHVEVRADRDDQLGALLVREQQRDVLADSRAPARPRTGGRAALRAPRPGASPPSYAWMRSSAPERSAVSDTESMSPTITSGLYPASSSASAPPSTPTSTGLKSRM